MRILKLQLRENEHILLDTEAPTTLTTERLLALLPTLLGYPAQPQPTQALPLTTRKYLPLAEYLRGSQHARVTLTYQELEELLGFTLPASAKRHRAWWGNSIVGHSQAAAWLNEGWRVVGVTTTAVTFQRAKGNDMAHITGRIGGIAAGYDLDLTWASPELTGRIGGRLAGRDVNLRIERDGGVHGRVGGRTVGFDVHGTLSPDLVTVRLGGSTVGVDAHVDLTGTTAHGRLGGDHLGKDVRLTLLPQGVQGRIGGRVGGKDVTVQGAPAELAVLAALITYQALEEDESTAAGS